MAPMSLSMRPRLLLVIGAMLLPLTILAVVSYFLFQRIEHVVNETVEEVRQELLPIMELRTLLERAAMPPNDYLFHGSTHEQKIFERLTAQINAKFDMLKASHFGSEDERSAVRDSRRHWHTAHSLGQALVTLSYPLADKQRAAMHMETFDSLIDQAVDDLSRVYLAAADELGQYTTHAEDIKNNVGTTVILVLMATFLLAIIGGIMLSRTILIPLRILDRCASRLGRGELDYRVELARDDEFGRLGRTFNEMAEKIERLATHDGLTGLYDRRAFGRLLDEEIQRSIRGGRPFSLLMIDVDNFKNINDTFGHPTGDEVLRTLATILTRDVRTVDRVARIGGEEFVVIMPDTTGADAAEIAERIRQVVADQDLRTPEDRPIKFTVSVGVATNPSDAESSEPLLAAADEALYQAKAAGRNCVRQATGRRSARIKQIR